jgi:hypothetical protein
VHPVGVNIVDEVCILQEYTVAFVVASKVTELEVNADQIQHMFKSRHFEIKFKKKSLSEY